MYYALMVFIQSRVITTSQQWILVQNSSSTSSISPFVVVQLEENIVWRAELKDLNKMSKTRGNLERRRKKMARNKF